MKQGQHAGMYRVIGEVPPRNEEWQWRIAPTQHLAIVKQALSDAQPGAPIIRMRLTFAADWRPREVICERDDEANPLRLLARCDVEGRWSYSISDAQRDTHRTLNLDPAAHVDLWTPQTNTATINRLALAEGGSADIVAFYIDPQTFVPRPMRQRYTRLADEPHNVNDFTLDRAQHYQYDSLNEDGTSQWTGHIWANDGGLVVDYPDLFSLIRYEPPASA